MRNLTIAWLAAISGASTALISGAMLAATGAIPGEPQAAEIAAAEAPPPAEVVAAWSTARAWLDGYALPREHEESAAVVVPNAFGVSVMLRANGAIVGRGQSAPADGLSLRRAMAQAMGEAWGNGVRSLAESLGEREVGPRITLELEIVGDPKPLLGRTIAEAATRIRPGLDGQAVRRGQRWAMGYSGRLLASNTAGNPATVFAALASELELPPRDLPELRLQDDVALYRLDGVRLVQLAPGDFPTVLFRDDELVPDAAVTRDSMARLASAVGHRLERTLLRGTPKDEDAPATTESSVEADPLTAGAGAAWPPQRGRMFRGEYRPSADEYRPAVADPADQTLAALALLRLAHSSAPASVPEIPGLAGACSRAALGALETLATDSAAAAARSADEPLADRRTASTVVLALLSLPPEERSPWLGELLKWALGAVQAEPPAGAAAPPNQLALEAAALAATHRAMPALVGRAEADAALDRAWHAAPEGRAAGLLPWIVWAQTDLAASPLAPGTAAPARSREPMLRLRDQVLASQADAGVDADLRGGISLRGPAGEPLPPTSQSLRPIAGLAAMLVDPALTPEVAVAPMLVRQRLAGRFMLQLAVRPPLERLARRPSAVANGIRNAMWDSDQPVAAQAMAILAALDTLRAIDRGAAIETKTGAKKDTPGASNAARAEDVWAGTEAVESVRRSAGSSPPVDPERVDDRSASTTEARAAGIR